MDDAVPTTSPTVSSPAARRVVAGDTIGRYLIVEQIGQGGMGTVYAARDPRLSREVALKVIRAEIGDGSYRARVMREAQSLARLSHPNVVPVFDVGIDLGVVWVAMQRVRGPTLAEWLATPRPWSAVLDAFVQAGWGLAAAHAAGLVHRDFKPGNAMFDADGRVLVLDFGLAWAPGSDGTRTAISGASAPPSHDTGPSARPGSGAGRDPLGLTLTATGAVVGTPPYMAPEQHAWHDVDARSDQYALCVSLYEGVFGRRPFVGDLEAIVAAKRAGAPSQPRTGHGATVPDRVWRVIERGLQCDPDRRWPDLATLLDALARARRPAPRWPAAVAAGAVVAIGVVASLHAEPTMRCEARDALDATWNEGRRAELGAAFTALGAAKDASWPRVEAHVDEAVARWRDRATRACEVDGIGDDRCVERAAVALDEALGVLGAADPTRAARAVRMIEGIAVAHDCAAAAHAAVPRLDEDMRRRHERGRALMAAGALEEAGAHAREMLDDAHAAGDAVAVAWSLLLLGGSEMDRGEREAADRHLRDALWTATAAGDDLAVTTAAIKLVHLCAYAFDVACAQPWLRNAEAGLARLGDGGEQAARELDLARGDVALRAAAFDEALGHYRRALASTRAAAGDLSLLESVLLSAIGSAQAMAGRHEEALESFAEADALEARELGDGDTARAVTLELRAGSLYALGRIPEARAALEQGLVNLDAAFGEGHPHAIRARGNLVLLLLDGGELEPARALAQKVVALKRAAFGPDDIQVAIGLYNEGTVHTRIGDHGLARQRYQEALALWERAVGPDHLDLAHPLMGLTNAHVELGAPDLAEQAGARARALHDAHRVPPPGELLFDLGRAAWLRGEHAEARAMVERSRDAFAPVDRPGHVGRGTVDGWLAEHPAAAARAEPMAAAARELGARPSASDAAAGG